MARTDNQNDRMALTSFLYGGNAHYIEELYAQYQDDPSSVASDWQEFFAELKDAPADIRKNAQGASWERSNWPVTPNGDLTAALDGNWGEAEVKNKAEVVIAKKVAVKITEPASPIAAQDATQATRDSVRAIMMIRAYRTRGHLHANLDPLGIVNTREDYQELHPSTYGFSEQDYDRKIFIDNLLGLEYASLREIVDICQRTYCGTMAVEFMHISNPAEKLWLQERIEGSNKGVAFTKNGKKAIFQKLVEAEGFEQFIDVKYKGTKRFGLDGGESLIPALEQIIKRGGQLGLKDIVLGMPHRGRLNVLTQVMGKPHRALFNEFKGGSFMTDEVEGSGDVKYHLGASSDRAFDGNTVHLSLTANPSHLESVDPVVMGKARAKQDIHAGGSHRAEIVPLKERVKVLPLLLHGDAAFAGQGVVPECLGLSALRGHRVAGTIHFIVNNQIGFTTNPYFSRSSPYPSDVAKMIEAPIFHVNGDDPEAVVYAAKVAIEFRMKFHKPVVIDMFCYRRFGHNEGDEPSFTQPLMYKNIRSHKTTVSIYAEKLVAENVLSTSDVEKIKNDWRERLEVEFQAGDEYKPNKADWLDGAWAGLARASNEDEQRVGKTAVPLKTLKEIGNKLTHVPADMQVHKTIQRFLDNRAAMVETSEGIDWAMGEALAFGSLQLENYGVRLSGQDCERGTFSQRHTVLYDQVTEKRYTPLNHIKKGQARYEVINSMLSEEAVLGFEYGYSLAEPNGLTIWEAQFGDFANGAQVVFDQFISSGERKWLRMCGLVCLLPHGYEGQGPEHSSARLERFLQMCAEDNMQVANCTTPANYFHILRRQMKRDFRKPLILMTPKSLLRHKRATSTLAEMSGESAFHRLLWDNAEYEKDHRLKLVTDSKIRRVVLCSGKVYYDLEEERNARGITDVYLLRIEQLYPFPAKALINELARFKNAEMVWCQEEPKNMGAWSFVDPYLEWVLAHINAKHQRVRYTGRPASASTATGLMSTHKAQLAAFLEDALSE